ESKDLDDLTVEGLFTNRAAVANPAPSFRQSHNGNAQYKPSAPILPSTTHLIVEGQPAHFFLYALYSELPNSQLLLFQNPIWHNFDEPLAYIQQSLTPTLRTLTFVTLDPLIYGGSRLAFRTMLRESGIACSGILHRVPENPEQEDALRQTAPLLAGIMV